MTETSLSLRGFGVAFGEQVILQDLCLALPTVGVTVLVGPAGGGKSTLLRTLAGLNDAHPALSTWGHLSLEDREVPIDGTRHRLPPLRRPVVVMQHARFYLDSVRENLVSALPNRSELPQHAQTELVCQRLRTSGMAHLADHLDVEAMSLPLATQRALAVVRALMSDPPVLFADEPTAGLEDHDAIDVLTSLRACANERAVVFVTHNQRLARAVGGTVMLLAGGRIQEAGGTRAFFESPRTEAGRSFVATGGCALPSPHGDVVVDDNAADASGATSPTSSPRPARRLTAPRGFFWVQPGKLGGLPRPGIIDSLDGDLAGLRDLGVTRLVTLEERRTVDASLLHGIGVKSVHFPVIDMGVPSLSETLRFCADVSEWIATGDVVALHCRAGLGRTGTLLACHLVWTGATAREALDAVRAINPRCVQSEEQVALLRDLEVAVRALRGDASTRVAPITMHPRPTP